MLKVTDRRTFCGGVAAWTVLGALGLRAAEDDSPELAAAKAWFREAQYGMMAHWGLYSLLAGEYRGKRMAQEYIGEWIQQFFRIPNAEYAKLTAAFNPIFFDAEEWVKTAQDAGMKYIVLTSKHHDGFALFHSKVSKFNVVDATPYKKDIVEQLAEACRKTGMKMGLYYSQDVDWHEKNGGGRFTVNRWSPEKGRAMGNDWDWPQDKSDYHFDEYFEGKSLPQVEEILTQYGDICLLWFDMAIATMKPGHSQKLMDLVRRLQPGCLINGRIGHGLGDYFTPGDNEVPKETRDARTYEVCGTMNDSWGFQPKDLKYRTNEQIRAIHEQCRKMHANYLLNFGPDPLGRMPAKAIEILEGLKG